MKLVRRFIHKLTGGRGNPCVAGGGLPRPPTESGGPFNDTASRPGWEPHPLGPLRRSGVLGMKSLREIPSWNPAMRPLTFRTPWVIALHQAGHRPIRLATTMRTVRLKDQTSLSGLRLDGDLEGGASCTLPEPALIWGRGCRQLCPVDRVGEGFAHPGGQAGSLHLP